MARLDKVRELVEARLNELVDTGELDMGCDDLETITPDSLLVLNITEWWDGDLSLPPANAQELLKIVADWQMDMISPD